jgi:hypothetical protein
MNKNKVKKGTKDNQQKPAQAGYILSERMDFLLTGGISICVMTLVLIYILWNGVADAPANVLPFIGSALMLHVLLNWPHFMGAYSILYQPISNIKKYPLATIYVPLGLIVLILVATFSSNDIGTHILAVNQDMAYFLWLVAAFYLAWHYTGQAWGMIITFSRLSGLELKSSEKLVIRTGLRLLLLWHVTWGAQDLPKHWLGGLSEYLPELLQMLSVTCLVAFVAGLYVWLKIKQRNNHIPDRRILASWFSIYMWYLVLFFMPEAYLLVQFSHSLQYLPFPLRVEINRASFPMKATEQAKTLFFSLKYYLILIASGLVVFYLPAYLFPSTQPYTFGLLVASAVSIHHYFVDSCIWKISNPEVRRALFLHLSINKNTSK